MLYTRWLARGTEEEFHWRPSPSTKEPVLIIMTPAQAHGHFKTVTNTTAGTTIIVQPRPGLTVWVTDVLITGEKQAGSDAIVQFTDGVQTEIIAQAFQVTVPPSLSGNLQTYFRGWKDARIELITSGTADAVATIGYIHSTDSPTYSEWDAER